MMKRKRKPREHPDWNELFEYRDGELYWKINRHNRTYPGQRAGCINPTTGYCMVWVCDSRYAVHRVIWEMFNGPLPSSDTVVRHINNIKTDNRIENLRIGSQQNNIHDMTRDNIKRKDNKTGIIGVHWHKAAGKWAATARYNGKEYHLGTFSNFFEACCARRSFEAKYFLKAE